MLAYRPKGEDEGLAGNALPLLGQVPRAIAFSIYLEGAIANQQRAVIIRKHLFQVRRRFFEARFALVEAIEEYLDQRRRGAGRAVQRDAFDLFKRLLAH